MEYPNVDISKEVFDLYPAVDKVIKEIKADVKHYATDFKQIKALVKRGEIRQVELECRIQCLCYDLARLYHTVERYENIVSFFLCKQECEVFVAIVAELDIELDFTKEKWLNDKEKLTKEQFKEELVYQGKLAQWIEKDHEFLTSHFSDSDYIRQAFSAMSKRAEKGESYEELTPEKYKENFMNMNTDKEIKNFMHMSAEILNGADTVVLLYLSIITLFVIKNRKLIEPIFKDNTPENHEKVLGCYKRSKAVYADCDNYKEFWQNYLYEFKDKNRDKSGILYQKALEEELINAEYTMRKHLKEWGLVYPGDDNISVLAWNIYCNLNQFGSEVKKDCVVDLDTHMRDILLIESIKKEMQGDFIDVDSVELAEIVEDAIPTIFKSHVRNNAKASNQLKSLLVSCVIPKIKAKGGKREQKWRWPHLYYALGDKLKFINANTDKIAFGRAMEEFDSELKAVNVARTFKDLPKEFPLEHDASIITDMVRELAPVVNLIKSRNS